MVSTADFDIPMMYDHTGTELPFSLSHYLCLIMFLKKKKNDTCRDMSERLILVLKPPIVHSTVHRNQSDLEGRRACVRARPQRRSNKERKWPLLACRRFFLVSYASFIIICFDASFLDVVSCSLCLFKTHSHLPPCPHR